MAIQENDMKLPEEMINVDNEILFKFLSSQELFEPSEDQMKRFFSGKSLS
jgi:hypothetical protein